MLTKAPAASHVSVPPKSYYIRQQPLQHFLLQINPKNHINPHTSTAPFTKFQSKHTLGKSN